MYWAYKNRRVLLWALAIIILLAAGYFLWQKFHPPQLATGESQQQAETAQGVDLAAHSAQVNMLQSQLVDAAKQITALKNQPPDTIVKTVPVEVVKTVEVERQKAGADFAIVTDPKQPDKAVDLKQVEKLPADAQVTLNQYNIKAFPDKLIEGTVYNESFFDIGYVNKIKIFGATGYIGPVILRSDNKTRIGARVSVPL